MKKNYYADVCENGVVVFRGWNQHDYFKKYFIGFNPCGFKNFDDAEEYAVSEFNKTLNKKYNKIEYLTVNSPVFKKNLRKLHYR